MTLTTNGRRTAPTDELTYRQILQVWLPLAFSWLLMLIESPFINGVLARLPEPELAIAAFGVIMSISVVVESPIVPLLTTSTALSKTRQHFLTIRRFTLILTGITVGLHFLVSWTPLYDLVVVPLINMPEELVEPVRAGLRVMVPWSGFVAWRRFNQGILIRYGYSGFVGRGTIMRLLAMGLTALGLGFLTPIPGVIVGGIAANLGTLAEAIYATIVTRPVIQQEFVEKKRTEQEEPPLTYRDLIAFHTPLFLSSLIFFLTRPLTTAGLSRTPNPTQTLAAWPVLLGLLSIVRAPVVAFPSVVVALANRKGAKARLRNFSLIIGFSAAFLFALVAFTPLHRIYFYTLMGVSDELTQIALSGAAFSLVLPIVGGISYYIRGVLTYKKFTMALTLSTIANITAMAIVLVVGISRDIPGVPLGALATSVSYVADLVVLALANRWLEKKEQRITQELPSEA
ncbi:MAG: hypothetical protein V2J07_02120 [Anaerolineae bacterium]|jgi:hypothetical protein|nr:hypothetical protein [Anaerolineae bacterium]